MKLVYSTIGHAEKVEATVTTVQDKVAILKAKFQAARSEMQVANAVDVTLADIEQQFDTVSDALDEALVDIRLMAQERRDLTVRAKAIATRVTTELDGMPLAAAYAMAQRDYSKSALTIYDQIVAAYIKVALYDFFSKKNLPVDEWK